VEAREHEHAARRALEGRESKAEMAWREVV